MDRLNILINERDEFDDYIYDFLIRSIRSGSFVPLEPFEYILDTLPSDNDSFWDPVIVCLTPEQINNQGNMMVEYKRLKLAYKRKKLYDSKVRTGWIIPKEEHK